MTPEWISRFTTGWLPWGLNSLSFLKKTPRKKHESDVLR